MQLLLKIRNRLLILVHSKFLLSHNIVFDTQSNSSDAARQLLFVERGAAITLLTIKTDKKNGDDPKVFFTSRELNI